MSAHEAVRLNNELGGRGFQVRVEQGNEPAHFIKIFHGKLIPTIKKLLNENVRCVEMLRAEF